MNVLYISGSPRKKSNTDYLLKKISSKIKGEFLKLSNFDIKHCDSCWGCRNQDECIIDDEMTNIIIPKLFDSDALVLGSPVYFNNVSSQLKTFIDRTWCIKGKLRNKIGGTVVVGRKYGHESAINAINSFFLKHEMIIVNRGGCGFAFQSEEIEKDQNIIESTDKLSKRIKELYNQLLD